MSRADKTCPIPSKGRRGKRADIRVFYLTSSGSRLPDSLVASHMAYKETPLSADRGAHAKANLLGTLTILTTSSRLGGSGGSDVAPSKPG